MKTYGDIDIDMIGRELTVNSRLAPKMQTKIVSTILFDHLATGQSCRLYRKQLRVPLTMLAQSMGIPIAQLSHMESGRRKWTAELVEKYALTCEEIADKLNPVPNGNIEQTQTN